MRVRIVDNSNVYKFPFQKDLQKGFGARDISMTISEKCLMRLSCEATNNTAFKYVIFLRGCS